MTKEDYEDYKANFQYYSAGMQCLCNGPAHGCIDCHPDALEMTRDEFFSAVGDGKDESSSFTCDLCKRPLAGTRYPAHGWLGAEVCHFSICSDCVYYMEYGQLDDMTMLEMENTNEDN